ncbi:MAG: LCP family protein [Ruminococcus sp.]|nr:LCP family protein [Ruminococcus sp.]
MIKNENNKKRKILPFFKYLTVVMVLLTLITLGLFKFINVLPNEYLFILFILLGIFTVFISSLILTRRGVRKRVIGTLLSLIYIVFLVVVIVYEINTIGFLKRVGYHNYKTENYSILVLKENRYQELKDLDKKKIGSLEFKTEGIKKAKDKTLKKIEPEFITYDDIGDLKEKFLKKEIDGILIENSMLAILTEDNEELASSYKVIYDFAIDVETKDITKNVDITNDAFNVYISGIDTYGAVSSVARSDVNMVVSINPKTKKVLITSVPRDYYIELDGKGKDKLTHAGIYGVETSVKALEDLLDIKINYYLKVNFTSLVDTVNALGGVEVNSNYAFTSRDGYRYKKGYNKLNGEEALSFVRERKAFDGGDRIRIENQGLMLEALINKALSPSIITKYNSLLKTLGKSFLTNIDIKDITEFIKEQINDMSSWEIEAYSLDGYDDYDYTYSYQGAKLYIMRPNNETVINAQNKIKEIFE